MTESDFTPDPRQLARLRELEKRYGLQRASQLAPMTEAERHRAEHGHRLSWGCCRPAGASGR